MKRILVTGATGYLGRHLITELKKQGYWIRALARNEKKLDDLSEYIDEVFEAEVTKPETLTGICDGIDYVISSIGITRQKDGLTYMDVDYRGNRNLLDIALNADVSKFMYISGLNAHQMRDLKIIRAKEKFADELKASAVKSVIIRPNGFFSDMLDFLNMAKKGKVNLFGDGEFRINPIHGGDLSRFCIESLNSQETEIEVGGPEILTHNQIAEIAFDVLDKKPKISYMPLWMKNIILSFMRLFTSSRTYGPIEFFMTALSRDMVAPAVGNEKIRDYFTQNI
ncbi:MAG: SDR family oxidoreductase [bacterium]|nr:SDR family oxidoreductase [bacterium]